MNAEIFKSLIDLARSFSGILVFFFGILVGYWMGRNSAERPFVQQTENVLVDQGSTDEPEGGDPFVDAMTEEEKPKQREKGIPTIIGDERLP
jgi:hypothetical protein